MLLALLLAPLHAVGADIVVIVNAGNPVMKLNRKQLIDLYMGRQMNFPTGSPALPIDLASGSTLRQTYYQTLVGKSEAKINAYWARLLFSGIASPPRVLQTPDAAVKIVRDNVAAIAYVDVASVIKDIQDSRIKVVFNLDAASASDEQ